jgi:hypothetical protein
VRERKKEISKIIKISEPTHNTIPKPNKPEEKTIEITGDFDE